ncbi:MAG: hypothetical protein SFY80_12730 [Verrucomicrobiota bacterium]|nr:hypothetical protein [Verrucomicrobiota bacterium]
MSRLILGLGLLAAPALYAGVYNFTVRVTDANGSFDEKPFSLTVLPAPPLAEFTSWAETAIPNPADRDPLADPDGDGVPNLLEYAFNLSPTAADGMDARPTVQLEQDKVSITFFRDAAKSDIIYMVEGSDDLQAWSDLIYNSSSPAPEYANNNAGTKMKITDTKTVDSAQPRRFMRVRIVSN